MKEWAVQRRIYTDKGFEEVETFTSRDFYGKPWTERQARDYVTARNASYAKNRDDTTGLPFCRLVWREVTEWRPPE